MARRDEATLLLLTGHDPVEIMSAMKLTRSTVMQYLFHQVGVGSIRRTDIVQSIPESVRNIMEALIKETGTTYWRNLQIVAEKKGIELDRDLLEIYLDLRDSRIALGDMYELVSEIEKTLHRLIKRVLESEYGPGERGWWRKGIPSKVREDCVLSRERDPEPAQDDYNYTTLMHLHDILDKQWAVFEKGFSRKLPGGKKNFLDRLAKINRIRNIVMHPIKDLLLTGDDFDLVYGFHRDLEELQSKLPSGSSGARGIALSAIMA